MEKWERREQKQNSKRHQMNKSGRSIFTVVRVQVKRAEQIRAEKGYKKGQGNG